MPTLVNATGNQNIDGLLWGYKWDFTNFLVRFPTSSLEYSGYSRIDGFTAFNQVQQEAIFLAVRNVQAFTPITFALTDQFGAGHFRFAQASQINMNDGNGLHTPGFGNNSAEGVPPDPTFPNYAQGDTWYNLTSYQTPQIGTFALAAGLLHELGHALGLKHGHHTQVTHGFEFPTLPFDRDSQEYSIMTYKTYVGQNPSIFPSGTIEYPWTYMQNDIAALQYLYGANFLANAGNTTYSFNETTGELTINDNGSAFGLGASFNSKIFLTIWDGNGNDTYDFSNYHEGVTVNLIPGEFSTFSKAQLAHLGDGHFARGNVANALLFNGDPRSIIENAIGGDGNDTFIGNFGNNIFDGGAGIDTAAFLSSRANYNVINNGGSITVSGGNGIDTLFSIERLQFADRFFIGDEQHNNLIGTSDDDTIEGGPGNDILTGHGRIDFLDGTSGHDTARFNGPRGDYNVTVGANAVLTVVDSVSGRDATDLVSNIDYLEFTDKTVVVAVWDDASIALLYSAALDRAPDTTGLNGWTDFYATGISSDAKSQGVYVALAQTPLAINGLSIAGGFTQSIEFQSKYGALNDTQYVTQLYNNVLDRNPEAAGLNGWLDLMNNSSFTREMVLVGFAASPENISKAAADWLIQI